MLFCSVLFPFVSVSCWGAGGFPFRLGCLLSPPPSLRVCLDCDGGGGGLVVLVAGGEGLFMSLSMLCARPYLHSLSVVKYSKV